VLLNDKPMAEERPLLVGSGEIKRAHVPLLELPKLILSIESRTLLQDAPKAFSS
jgi:hypothetical protein